MPEIGTVCRGSDLGFKGAQYIWVHCPDCPEGDNQRWAPYKVNTLQAGTVRRCKEHHRLRNRASFQLRPK